MPSATSLTLTLSLVLGATGEKPGAARAGEASYRAGIAALADKDGKRAQAALERCVEQAPARVDRRWELGWAYMLLRRWDRVVSTWEEVKRRDPSHPEVDRHLNKARAQLALAQQLAKSEAAAPERIVPRATPSTTLRFRAAGDVMLGTLFPPGYLAPDDGAHLLAAVAPTLRDADVTFINLEGPLCDDGETKKCRKGGNCYAFRSPTRYAKYLQDAGVDLASTANNHSGDFGEPCRRQTEAALDAAHIAWSGPPESVAHIERKGLKIAMIAFHTNAACNDVNDHDTAARLVAREARSNDIVVVSFHGGAEGSRAQHVPAGEETFYGENRGALRSFTHRVVDAGADLVFGHGPHVLRGMEIYKGRLIAYSLGNFATYGRFNLTGALGVGAILDVTVDGVGAFVGGKIIATQQTGKGVPSLDESGAAVRLVRKLSREDFPTTHVRVAKDGTLGAR